MNKNEKQFCMDILLNNPQRKLLAKFLKLTEALLTLLFNKQSTKI